MRWASALVRLYPRAYRERHRDELVAAMVACAERSAELARVRSRPSSISPSTLPSPGSSSADTAPGSRHPTPEID